MPRVAALHPAPQTPQRPSAWCAYVAIALCAPRARKQGLGSSRTYLSSAWLMVPQVGILPYAVRARCSHVQWRRRRGRETECRYASKQHVPGHTTQGKQRSAGHETRTQYGGCVQQRATLKRRRPRGTHAHPKPNACDCVRIMWRITAGGTGVWAGNQPKAECREPTSAKRINSNPSGKCPSAVSLESSSTVQVWANRGRIVQQSGAHASWNMHAPTGCAAPGHPWVGLGHGSRALHDKLQRGCGRAPHCHASRRAQSTLPVLMGGQKKPMQPNSYHLPKRTHAQAYSHTHTRTHARAQRRRGAIPGRSSGGPARL